MCATGFSQLAKKPKLGQINKFDNLFIRRGLVTYRKNLNSDK